MKLSDIKAGMLVVRNGSRYKVLSVNSKQKYPVLAKHLDFGIVGRFLPQSVQLVKL